MPLVLDRFMTIVRPHYERVVLNVSESRTLATLRDTLLPKLLSGEIALPAADAFVEDVV